MSDSNETMKLLLAGTLKPEDLFKPSQQSSTTAKNTAVTTTTPSIRVARPVARTKKIHIPKWLQAYKR